jgi:hypothetical protein
MILHFRIYHRLRRVTMIQQRRRRLPWTTNAAAMTTTTTTRKMMPLHHSLMIFIPDSDHDDLDNKVFKIEINQTGYDDNNINMIVIDNYN